MTTFRLPSNLHFCEVDDRRVFLDLAADRYFMLPPTLDTDFLAVLRGGVPSDPERLLRTGILVRGSGGRPIAPTRHALPDRSLVEESEGRERTSPAKIVEAWLLVATVRRSLAAGGLPGLLARVAADPRVSPQDGDIERAAGAFLAARRYVPIPPGCLHDSLALSAWLARRRLFPRLVIGVKLHPFGAHCWLQQSGMVLNDTLAAARGFSPVLVA